jgi:hypothetical protein
MVQKILVVTRDFYAAEAVKNLLTGDVVRGCHRDYLAEGAIASFKPDYILTDMTCKTRMDFLPDPVSVYFNPEPLAKKYSIPVRSLTWFLFVQKVKKILSKQKMFAV